MKVINFGSLNVDYVYQVDHIVRPGETLAATERHIYYGGKGLNQSIALAKAGVLVYHAGLIGNGGDGLVTLCKKTGINTDYIRKVEGENGHTIIQVDTSGQNCILLYGGSNQKITKEFVDEVLAHFQEGDLILLQNEISEMPYIIDKAYEKGLVIVCNPSPYNEVMEECDLSKISIFMINEVEGEQITGEVEPRDILEEMGKCYPTAKVVLTLGSKGVIYQEAGVQLFQEAKKVKAVDTTAAGDTFTGYFIAGLLEGLSKEENLKRCVKASALTVSKRGAADSIPTREELE